MLNVFIVLMLYGTAFLVSCNAENDVLAIKNQIKDCQQFKPTLKGIPVDAYTPHIRHKIEECNKLHWGNSADAGSND